MACYNQVRIILAVLSRKLMDVERPSETRAYVSVCGQAIMKYEDFDFGQTVRATVICCHNMKRRNVVMLCCVRARDNAP